MPVRLILLIPAVLIETLYQPPIAVLPKVPTFFNVAKAWKSVASRVIFPKAPVLMSTSSPPKTVKGLLPMGLPDGLMRNIADVITALGGRLEVLKDKIVLYCRLKASSPSWKVLLLESMVPPLLLVRVDSSTQPSYAPADVNVSVFGPGGCVTVAVGVRVWVGVNATVRVGVGVRVTVAVRVGVTVGAAAKLALRVKEGLDGVESQFATSM
jgi:hypothetical protein